MYLQEIFGFYVNYFFSSQRKFDAGAAETVLTPWWKEKEFNMKYMYFQFSMSSNAVLQMGMH